MFSYGVGTSTVGIQLANTIELSKQLLLGLQITAYLLFSTPLFLPPHPCIELPQKLNFFKSEEHRPGNI